MNPEEYKKKKKAILSKQKREEKKLDQEYINSNSKHKKGDFFKSEDGLELKINSIKIMMASGKPVIIYLAITKNGQIIPIVQE